jgi:flavin reductase (DIM6/NTAB) family NADH-FMN oxidoreductase RutF
MVLPLREAEDISSRPLSSALAPYRYVWPRADLQHTPGWATDGRSVFTRQLPESPEELALDSRWPALFPSPICLVTTGDASSVALEKVVGASIVNRFPYIVALSFCRQPLSDRHYVRRAFMDALERHEEVAVQFLAPGETLDKAMDAIASIPDDRAGERVSHAGLSTRPGRTTRAQVLTDAYLVYEARLVKPGRDFEGVRIYSESWTDAGSHRIYYFEITAIQLRQDIAEGRSQIHWRSLPAWRPGPGVHETRRPMAAIAGPKYQKGYTPHYSFPSAGTIAFEADETRDGMAVKFLPPLPEDQVEVNNDRARWPCFFPSSVGMITTWADNAVPNVMPCGSTTIVSRNPLIVTPCVSYAAINERYAPRTTLDVIRKAGRFGCGVPFIEETVLNAIKYCGNVSLSMNPDKVRDAGLEIEMSEWAPIPTALPVYFECEVVGEVRLGTHIMFLGEVRRIRVRADVTPDNPIEWCPWADVAPSGRAG